AHVDHVCPIAKTSYVYYDDEVYDSVLVEKSTGITYVTQLIFDSETKVYYVYYRWGETDYKLEGPHETVESAKDAFLITYKEKFDIEWQEREIAVSEKWTYETKTYETFEEIEEVEEIVEETEAQVIIAREQEVVVEGYNTGTSTSTTTTTTTGSEVVVEQVTEGEDVFEGEEVVKVITTTRETGVVAKPAVTKESSWFRRIAAGAGAAAAGALTQVDGVWKRSVEVLTTRKAHVDHVCPIAKTSYVYYDDEVYDSVLIEKSTGITYVTQLIFDSETKVYYVYYRSGETDYKLEGPHTTIEAAKSAFLVNYQEKFGIQWSERVSAVSERWTYEMKTYETFEETEEIDEIVEDYEQSEVVASEREIIIQGEKTATTQSVTETHDDSVVRTVTEKVLFQDCGSADARELSRTQYEAIIRADADSAAGQRSSSTVVVDETKQTKKTLFDLASLPQLGNVGINADTGAADGVIDLRSGTAETLRELPAHLRPRAWVSLHVGGWQDAPHELEGFMRLDDQSGQRLMEDARDAAQDKAQEATRIDNLRLPEIVALFAQKLYGHFGEELPDELTMERLSQLGPHRG
ncbi:hypothetical protein BGX28_009421, partial [Mortierella sp. GBA30]